MDLVYLSSSYRSLSVHLQVIWAKLMRNVYRLDMERSMTRRATGGFVCHLASLVFYLTKTTYRMKIGAFNVL